MNRLLKPRFDELMAEVRERHSLLGVSTLDLETAKSRVLRPKARLEMSGRLLDKQGSAVDGRVILMPAAAYHVEETGPIAEELYKRGIQSVVMVSDRRWPSVEHAESAFAQPVIATVEAGDWLGRAAGVVVMNDWGEEYREYVDAANDLGVPTFAKVEGVQDFKDDDVHWDRKAYQHARLILAQGDNDVLALSGKESVKVSNNRLERIWLGPERTPGRPLVVVNLNFTYGVLEDARDMWLESVVEACEQIDVPYVISLHPAERDSYEGSLPIANAPMRYLLTRASALVSRFSTVPFEAMARGVPFVYHNPHGERVSTFFNPEGAYDVTTSETELAAALKATGDWQHGYRERASRFFLKQVDVEIGAPAPARAAEVIVGVLHG
jgi:hypothetical protein